MIQNKEVYNMLSPKNIKKLQELHTEYEENSKLYNSTGDVDALTRVWKIQSQIKEIVYSYSNTKKIKNK